MPPKPRKQRILAKTKKMTRKWSEVPFRSKMYCILDRVGLRDVEMPTAARYARTAVFSSMIFITVIMTLAIIIESLPQYAELGGFNFFTILIMLCVVIFTADWILRLVATPEPLQYLMNPLNIIDIVGLIPFWLEQGGVIDPGTSKLILVLRVTRLVRALLFVKRFEIVIDTVEESTEVGALLLLILLVALPMFGNGMYFAERGTFNETTQLWYRNCSIWENCTQEVSPFQNSVDGMWFAINVVTTLGLGDIFPKSDTGKCIAAVGMCVGVFLLSFPVMILAVNYEHEKVRVSKEDLRQAARLGRRLRSLQTENMVILEEDENAASIQVGMSTVRRTSTAPQVLDDELGGSVVRHEKRAKPVYFTAPEDKGIRRALMIGRDCRYEPLLIFQRDKDGHVVLEQPGKNPLEFKFNLILGTHEAATEARNTMNMVLPPDAPSVARCFHFHVLEVHFALVLPDRKCEFLKSARLLRSSETNIEPNRKVVSGVLELLGYRGTIDEQKRFDLIHALKRCRLAVSAAVAYNQPTHFDVPIFLDMLRATNLVKEILLHKGGVVFLTEKQVNSLLNGVQHLIDLTVKDSFEHDGTEIIINGPDIVKQVTKAVLKECSTVCDDPSQYQDSDFLYGDRNPNETYYGILRYRLTGVASESANPDFVYEDDEEEDESRGQRVLVNVLVKAVKPTYVNTIVSF